MTALLTRIAQYWFFPARARLLAVVRILVGTFSLHYLGSAYFQFPARVSGSADLYDPVGLAVLLPDPLPASVFQCLVLAMLLANVAFVLGWRHRTSGPLFGLLTVFVLCYRNSWGMVYHTDNLLVLHALILGLSRSADAFSLDALGRHADGLTPAGQPSWHYGWPIRLIGTITVVTYVLAGVAKVAGPLGWAWAGAASLQSQVAFDGLRKEFLAGGAPELIFTLYGLDGLFLAMGVVTLVVELGAPAALLHAWLARVWALGAVMMHWGIYVIMDITFSYSMMGLPFLVFFPLDRWLGRSAAAIRTLAATGLPGRARDGERHASVVVRERVVGN